MPHDSYYAGLAGTRQVLYGEKLASLKFPRTPNCAAGFRAGVLTVLENLDTVHEDVFHADGVLMRFLEGGAIGNRFWIEDDDVGEHSFFEEAAAIEAEIGGG